MSNQISTSQIANLSHGVVSGDPKSLEQLTDSETLAAHFVRARYSRNDLSMAILAHSDARDFWTELERVRSKIYSGSLAEAEDLLNRITPKPGGQEEAEFLIEKMRISVRRGQATPTLETGSRLTQIRNQLAPSSLMTYFQLLGHAHFLSGNLDEAISQLRQCIALSNLFPGLQCVFSAHAFLVKIYSEQGALEEAISAFSGIEKALASISRSDEVYPDRLRSVLRAESFLAQLTGQTKRLETCLIECALISLWLGSPETYESSRKDLELQGLNLSWTHEDFLKLDWFFISRHNLMFWSSPHRAIDLSKQGSCVRSIQLLSKKSGVELPEYFKSMWKINYRKELHGNRLRASISKVRKFLPQQSLIQDCSLLSLKNGMVV